MEKLSTKQALSQALRKADVTSRFIGIEKDEKYFEIAKNRINEYK